MTVIAIDFGTSNTAIAILDEALDETVQPRTLNLGDIAYGFKNLAGVAWLVPSLVYVQARNQFLYGQQVRSRHLSSALSSELSTLSAKSSPRLFQGFKRDIVANFRSPARELDGQLYDAEAIAEIFIEHLWQQIALQNIQPSQVILTVPVGAFEAYRHWFRQIAQRLQFPNLKIIDESTAAALGYGMTRPNALVLVIDFGGGTLDLSLVRTAPIANPAEAYRAEVIAKSDAYIGGMDIDRAIAEYYLRNLGKTRSQLQESQWLDLLNRAEQIKIQLSLAPEVQTLLEGVTLHLTQDQLTEILEQAQITAQLREAIDEVLTLGLHRGVSKAEIEQVLLVGGSCQIVAVQQLISAYFGKSKVKMDKPFEAVAHGALSLGQAIAIEDHLRHSYAIRLWEPYLRQYSFYPIFAKGTKYPCQSAEPIILQAAIANQAEICLDVGEISDIAQAEVNYDASGRMISSQLLKQSDFRSLMPRLSDRLAANPEQKINFSSNNYPDPNFSGDANCIAHLNPLGQLGRDRLTLSFEIDERRRLLVTIVDLLTHKKLMERQAIVKLD